MFESMWWLACQVDCPRPSCQCWTHPSPHLTCKMSYLNLIEMLPGSFFMLRLPPWPHLIGKGSNKKLDKPLSNHLGCIIRMICLEFGVVYFVEARSDSPTSPYTSLNSSKFFSNFPFLQPVQFQHRTSWVRYVHDVKIDQVCYHVPLVEVDCAVRKRNSIAAIDDHLVGQVGQQTEGSG